MRELAAFFFLALALSWSLVVAGVITVAGTDGLRAGVSGVSAQQIFVYLIASSFGPTIAGLIVMSLGADRRERLRRWAGSLVRIKATISTYALMLLAIPAGLIVASLAFGFRPAEGVTAPLVYVTLLLAPLNGVFAAIGGLGPLGEEPGWRGYANARLRDMAYSDWKIVLIIAPFWLAWHLPIILFVGDFRPEGIALPTYLGLYAISIVLLTFCTARLWRATESTLLCIWLHGIANAALPYLADGAWDAGGFGPTGRMAASIVGLGLAAIAFALFTRPLLRSDDPAQGASNA